MEITFVRHGETDLNKENRIQGSATNYPLNEAGEAYARKAAAVFDPEAYDIVFVSPLTRAKQTAEIFTKGKQELTLSLIIIFKSLIRNSQIPVSLWL